MTPNRHASPAHIEGLRVIEQEAATLAALGNHLDCSAFDRAVETMLDARAHVIVTGMGKSGHIGAKIAATLASTGTPAFFLHPAEAVHGDLGMLTGQNVVLALSHSGTTEEVLNLIPYIQLHAIPLVVITGNATSQLASRAKAVLAYKLDQEACPLNLAPTASTIAQMALGDALAGALMRARGFTDEDFAIRHPLGALGRRLLIHVRDLMAVGDENPVMPETALLKDAISRMMRLGAVSLVDEEGKLAGIFCDGDLRRLLSRGPVDPAWMMKDIMIRNPKRIHPDVLGTKAVDLMETHKITVLPVVDEDDMLVGMIHLHSLIQAGITQ